MLIFIMVLIMFYQQDAVANYIGKEDIIREMLDSCWLTNTKYYLILSVLVHKKKPDIATDPTKVPAGTTRSSQHQDEVVKLMKRCLQAKENEAATTKQGKIEGKQQEGKVALMEQALNMGKVEEVKEQLHLMKEFKESMDNIEANGDAASEFDKAAYELLLQLPFMQQRQSKGKEKDNN